VKSKNRLPACERARSRYLPHSVRQHLRTRPWPPGTLDEVVVTGVRQALRTRPSLKKNSDLISDNISTADIGQLPDVTDCGGAQSVAGRQHDARPGQTPARQRSRAWAALGAGLVNGRRSPPPNLRRPALGNLTLPGAAGAQVYKTQDATLVPGGIAATVDIRTLSPLDIHGPAFSFRAGPTYKRQGQGLARYDPKGYRGSDGFVGHINDDVAVSIAASVQREKNGFPDFRTFGWNTPQTPVATPAT